MSKNEFEKLKELALKGRLDKESEKRLKMYIQADPLRSIPDLENEILLGKLLRELPQVPVSSNFTARVLAEIEAIEAEPLKTAPQGSLLDWLLYHLGYRIGAVATILVLVGFCYFSHEEFKNVKLANKIVELSNVAPLEEKESKIAVEIFKDFEIIQSLGQQSAFVDTELLAALKAK